MRQVVQRLFLAGALANEYTHEAAWRPLGEAPARFSARAVQRPGGVFAVTVSAHTAVAGVVVRGALCDDGYVTLLPGEDRTFTCPLPDGDAVVEGLNAEPVHLPPAALFV